MGKRHLVDPAKVDEMLRFFERNLLKEGFFEGLGTIDTGKPLVRFGLFDGINVIVKDTNCSRLHGADYETIRNKILKHQLAVRKGIISPESYVLVSTKVYGRIGGRYLVMEYVDNKRGTAFPQSSLRKAINELETNWGDLRGNNQAIGVMPQKMHVLVWGNTNPKHPEKGKWVISFPYDYA